MTTPIGSNLTLRNANLPQLGAATSSSPAHGASAASDDYCGTPVPGHPPIPHGQFGQEKLDLSAAARAVLGGGGGLGTAADAGDDWCGTRVPGHFPPRGGFPGVGGSQGILIGL